MSRKRGAYRMGGNCIHPSVYGYRTRQCPRCEVFLRPADFSTQGICVWCQFDMDEPARQLAALQERTTYAGNTISSPSPPGSFRSTR
jgi:hypothetical protein